MDSQRIDQSLSELTFCVFRRALHPELFDIYASRRFVQGEYEVIIWVTGCGHVVQVFHGNHCITECICPPDQLLPKRGLVEQFAFRGEKSHKCQWSKGFTYMMSLQVEAMSANLFKRMHTELVGVGKKRGLFVAFAQWARGDLVPFSFLDYEAGRDELQLNTFHAFPEQQTMLKTQSLITLTAAKK